MRHTSSCVATQGAPITLIRDAFSFPGLEVAGVAPWGQKGNHR